MSLNILFSVPNIFIDIVSFICNKESAYNDTTSTERQRLACGHLLAESFDIDASPDLCGDTTQNARALIYRNTTKKISVATSIDH